MSEQPDRRDDSTTMDATLQRRNATLQQRNATITDPGAPAAPSAVTVPQIVASDETAEKESDPRLPNSTVLARKATQAMENLFVEQGYSYTEIGELFGDYDKSSVGRHLKYLSNDVEKQRLHEQNRKKYNRDANVGDGQQPRFNNQVEPAASQPSPALEPPSAIPSVIYEGSSPPSYFPKTSAEIYGPRPPRIVDEYDGNNNAEGAVPAGETGSPKPITVIVNAHHPSIRALFLELLQLATIRGLSLEAYLGSETCSQDFRDLALAKQAIVGSGESFRANLLSMLKKAVAFDKNRRETGLIRTDSDMMEDEL